MGSPDVPDVTVDAATAPSDAAAPGGPVAALPPAPAPVYRPRSRPVIWTFALSFLLATATSAVIVWLILR